MSAGGDAGEPVVLGDSPAAEAFIEIAERIVTDISPPVEMAGCTARMLDLAAQALDDYDEAQRAETA